MFNRSPLVTRAWEAGTVVDTAWEKGMKERGGEGRRKEGRKEEHQGRISSKDIK
jgi:hypothetical protein